MRLKKNQIDGWNFVILKHVLTNWVFLSNFLHLLCRIWFFGTWLKYFGKKQDGTTYHTPRHRLATGIFRSNPTMLFLRFHLKDASYVNKSDAIYPFFFILKTFFSQNAQDIKTMNDTIFIDYCFIKTNIFV